MSKKTTLSVSLDDMSLDQLVQVQQGLGREIDRLREQRVYLNAKIAQRLAAGERNGAPDPVDAVAPGAVIVARAQ